MDNNNNRCFQKIEKDKSHLDINTMFECLCVGVSVCDILLLLRFDEQNGKGICDHANISNRTEPTHTKMEIIFLSHIHPSISDTSQSFSHDS